MQHTNMQTITIKQSTTIIALVTVAIILIAIPIANISSPVGAQQQEQKKNTSTNTGLQHYYHDRRSKEDIKNWLFSKHKPCPSSHRIRK